VMEGDIRGCFDNINHRILLRIIRRRIKDKRLLSLIKKILTAGYIENGKVNKPGYGLPKIGTPQGGIISPLFANIYLHEFDKWLNNSYGSFLTMWQRIKRRRQSGGGNAILIRYADDFVVLWNGSKKNLMIVKEEAKQYLKQELELELSEEKTVITHANDGFEFLGFNIQRRRYGKKKYAIYTSVPTGKIRKFKQKIQRTTIKRGAVFESVAYKIMAINSIVIGFAEYYRYTNWKAMKIPKRLDWFIEGQLYRWLRRKHKKLSSKQVMKKYLHRQKKWRLDGSSIDRKNIGFKIEATYVTNEEVIWLEKMEDRQSKKYLPKKKLNPFITYQYGTENNDGIGEQWEGRSDSPYISDEYFTGKKLAMKRDKYKCRNCGAKVTVSVNEICHHIDGNNKNHSLDNLATLCVTCHYLTYGKEKEINL
jgi:group II intron reverse transcriptase/maturase